MRFRFHDIEETSKRLKKLEEDDRISFFSATLHSYLPHNIISIIHLISAKQYFSTNLILRNTIEFLLYSIWIDIVSKLGGTFDFYWDNTEWKPLLRTQRADENLIKGKIKLLAKINKRKNESIEMFKDRFFKESNEVDMLLFFSKFICDKCLGKKEFKKLNIDLIEYTDKEPDEKDIDPIFEHSIKCDWCRNKNIKGFVFYVPTHEIIFDVFKKYLEKDETINALNDLKKCYSILSNYFIHFSMNALPFVDDKVVFKINKKNINFNSFEIVEFVFNRLSFILCNYFMILKNEFKIYEYSEICDIKKNKFNWYNSKSLL